MILLSTSWYLHISFIPLIEFSCILSQQTQKLDQAGAETVTGPSVTNFLVLGW